MGPVAFGIVKAAPGLTVLAHGCGLSTEQGGRPGAMMRLQPQPLVRTISGQLLKTVGDSAALDHPAPAVCRYPKPKDRHEQLACPAHAFAQLICSRIGFTRGIRGETFGCNQREAAGQLQLDFSAVALPPFAERR
jgi:hypothetical protein